VIYNTPQGVNPPGTYQSRGPIKKVSHLGLIHLIGNAILPR
jgi:hypothetical protein